MADDAPAAAPAAVSDPLQAAASAIAQAEQAGAARASAIDAAVAAWLDAHIRNSPVSRATDAWNALTAALPALVAALKEI